MAHVCLAHGSISFVRTRRIPVVSSVASAISDVGLDAADHYLDRKHFPDLRHVALAHNWASVGLASWLGDAAGIWMRGSGRINHCVSPPYTICEQARKPLKCSHLGGESLTVLTTSHIVKYSS